MIHPKKLVREDLLLNLRLATVPHDFVQFFLGSLRQSLLLIWLILPLKNHLVLLDLLVLHLDEPLFLHLLCLLHHYIQLFLVLDPVLLLFCLVPLYMQSVIEAFNAVLVH